MMGNMNRLKPGDSAPKFDVKDLSGNRLTLEDYRGKKLLLCFFRFASCPYCNLRVHDLIQRIPELRSQGLYVVAVFQSPAKTIQKYVGKQQPPFPIIPDQNGVLYESYKLETSWKGILLALLFRFGDMMRALMMGFRPGSIDGHLGQLPGEFLIGEELTILEAYYGNDVGDYLPFDIIESYL